MCSHACALSMLVLWACTLSDKLHHDTPAQACLPVNNAWSQNTAAHLCRLQTAGVGSIQHRPVCVWMRVVMLVCTCILRLRVCVWTNGCGVIHVRLHVRMEGYRSLNSSCWCCLHSTARPREETAQVPAKDNLYISHGSPYGIANGGWKPPAYSPFGVCICTHHPRAAYPTEFSQFTRKVLWYTRTGNCCYRPHKHRVAQNHIYATWLYIWWFPCQSWCPFYTCGVDAVLLAVCCLERRGSQY